MISLLNKIFATVLICSLLLFASSCKTKKIVTGGRPATSHKQDSVANENQALGLIQKTLSNEIDYDWLSTRVRVEYSDDHISQDFAAVVRMRRDSVLWISLQGPFGIEGCRIMLTRDSIFVINKLSGEYLRQPLSYLSTVMPMQTDISQLQDFVMGYYLLFAGAAPEYRGLEDSMRLLQAESPVFRYRAKLFPQNYTLTQTVLTDKMLSRQMSVTFGGYSQEAGKPFSAERTIDIKQGSRAVNIHLVFTKIKVNEIQSFPFDIDQSLKKVDKIRF